jgi:hypothetical protein
MEPRRNNAWAAVNRCVHTEGEAACTEKARALNAAMRSVQEGHDSSNTFCIDHNGRRTVGWQGLQHAATHKRFELQMSGEQEAAPISPFAALGQLKRGPTFGSQRALWAVAATTKQNRKKGKEPWYMMNPKARSHPPPTPCAARPGAQPLVARRAPSPAVTAKAPLPLRPPSG